MQIFPLLLNSQIFEAALHMSRNHVTSPRPNRARLLTSTARAFRLKGLTEPP